MLKFSLGQLVATRGIADKMQDSKEFSDFIARSLARYKLSDWGDTNESDKLTNDHAVDGQDRIIAAYDYNSTTTIWIITEWDRSCTTILFPSEY